MLSSNCWICRILCAFQNLLHSLRIRHSYRRCNLLIFYYLLSFLPRLTLKLLGNLLLLYLSIYYYLIVFKILERLLLNSSIIGELQNLRVLHQDFFFDRFLSLVLTGRCCNLVESCFLLKLVKLLLWSLNEW
jgi:hypothetical protein